MLAERRVGLAIRENDETQLHQFFRSLEGLHGVGEQIAGVGMDFEFQPVGAEGFAGHLCGKHRFFGIAHSAGVGQKLDMLVLRDVRQQVVLLVLQLYALHRHGHHFRFGSFDGTCHDLVVVEFAGTEEKA